MITRRVKALQEFKFHTAEVDRLFVEGEVAGVLFRNEKALQSFVELGLFQEVSLDTPLGVPAIPVLRSSVLDEEELAGPLPPVLDEDELDELLKEEAEDRMDVPLSVDVEEVQLEVVEEVAYSVPVLEEQMPGEEEDDPETLREFIEDAAEDPGFAEGMDKIMIPRYDREVDGE